MTGDGSFATLVRSPTVRRRRAAQHHVKGSPAKSTNQGLLKDKHKEKENHANNILENVGEVGLSDDYSDIPKARTMRSVLKLQSHTPRRRVGYMISTPAKKRRKQRNLHSNDGNGNSMNEFGNAGEDIYTANALLATWLFVFFRFGVPRLLVLTVLITVVASVVAARNASQNMLSRALMRVYNLMSGKLVLLHCFKIFPGYLYAVLFFTLCFKLRYVLFASR